MNNIENNMFNFMTRNKSNLFKKGLVFFVHFFIQEFNFVPVDVNNKYRFKSRKSFLDFEVNVFKHNNINSLRYFRKGRGEYNI